MSKKLLLATSVVAILTASPAMADSDDIKALRAEIQEMKTMYESRIESLEQRLAEMELLQPSSTNQTTAQISIAPPPTQNVPASAIRRISENTFNPSIGVILNGRYGSYSERDSELAGFAIGEEAERGEEGLTIDETEINFAANVDDKFRGAATVALHEHEGEGVEVEIEEAFLETLSLPYGFNIRAGRFFSDLGYLNLRHPHEDDFVDRPLPNRAFLNNFYNDDGVQVSWILPTTFYSEVGGSILQGDDFPAGGGDGSDFGSWTAYGRIGGDVGENIAWRLGVSTLQTSGIERDGNEDTVEFEGDSDMYIADIRAVWAPTGNNYEQELILQGEYFFRDEDGTYNDTDAGLSATYDNHQSGWYAQSVYKFHPQWRVGARYSELNAGDIPAGLIGSALDDDGHDPWNATAMIDWSNSEFSRFRLQYSHEELAGNLDDEQVILQYIMSIGAHGAHPF